MMKKLIALVTVLCCLCLAVALAESDVWGLYVILPEGEYLLGTAVSCGDGQLLSVDGIVVDGMVLHAGRYDERVQISHAAGFENGVLVLYADGISGEIPAASGEKAETVYVEAVGRKGLVSAAGILTTDIVWQNQNCKMMTCEAELTVGAPVMDQQGALMGLVAAVWGEGINEYVVLPADTAVEMLKNGIDENSATIYDSVPDILNGLQEQKQTTADDRWLKEFSVSVDAGKITVDWSGAQHTAGEGEKYFVIFMDIANPFYSYMDVEGDKTSVSFYAAPERAYAVWVQCSTPEDFSTNMDMSAVQMFTTEAAVPFDQYAYRDNELYLGVVPAGSEENTVKAEKLDKITVADIIDQETDFCMQAVSQYEVTEEITVMMQTVLTTPEGYAFVLDSSYIFIPEMMDNDVWNVALEYIFNNYQQFSGFISVGEYSVAYYFNGQLAGSLTFTIE